MLSKLSLLYHNQSFGELRRTEPEICIAPLYLGVHALATYYYGFALHGPELLLIEVEHVCKSISIYVCDLLGSDPEGK